MDQKLLKIYFKLLAQLIQDEGCRLTPYIDTVGKVTIGIGHNLTDRGISMAVALQMASEDIENAYSDTLQVFPEFATFSDNRQLALINMMFNLGAPTFSQFRGMIEAVHSRDWGTAAQRAIASKWALQVGNRANRIHDLIKNG